MNRWLDRLVARVMRRGRLEVTWSDGSVSHYGDGAGHAARIHFREPSAEWAVLRNPELALGEAYMDGRIEFPGRRRPRFPAARSTRTGRPSRNVAARRAAFARCAIATRRFTQNNSMLKSRRNVAHHYDLDERLYRLFLDSDMQYSCAYFETPRGEPRGGAMGEEAPSRRQAGA